MHPLPSQAWGDFTLMMECSVIATLCTLWLRPFVGDRSLQRGMRISTEEHFFCCCLVRRYYRCVCGGGGEVEHLQDIKKKNGLSHLVFFKGLH